MTTSESVAVDQVIDRMTELQAGLPPSDGVAVFNRMYLEVTRTVRERLAADWFADPASLTLLDTLFASRYLAAVDADRSGDRAPACWRPLFALRAHPAVQPLQFALAGMNAHIEHDLPMAVVDTCHRLGRTPQDVDADYHRMNDLLAQLESRVRDELLPDQGELREADPLLHVVGVWSIDRARDAAWASVLALWELRGSPAAFEVMAGALSRSVGVVSQALLTPLATPG